MRTWLARLSVAALLAGVIPVAMAGCGAKEYLNCRSICDKKKTCGNNSNYDVDNCVNTCSDNANNDSNYARLVDTCKECEDPLSCTDPKLVSCFGNCPTLP